MKLSQLINLLTEIQKLTNEDLDVLDDDFYPIDYANVNVSDGTFPEDYDLPKGLRWITLTSSCK
jgi:hypothetical protein